MLSNIRNSMCVLQWLCTFSLTRPSVGSTTGKGLYCHRACVVRRPHTHVAAPRRQGWSDRRLETPGTCMDQYLVFSFFWICFPLGWCWGLNPEPCVCVGQMLYPQLCRWPRYRYLEKPSNSMADSAEEIRICFPKEGDVIWNMWSKQAFLSWEGWMWGRWTFQMGNSMYKCRMSALVRISYPKPICFRIWQEGMCMV